MKPNFPKSKWFYAFLIAAVIALAAAVVAIVIAVNANRPPEVPEEEPTVEGEKMSGVYYYDVEGGEVVLTLSDSYTFTIAGPGMNKTGTYTIEGSTIHLDFFKDEDGVTTATLNGESLSLVYGDATMSFEKKVNYTVTFNTNGGSEIPAASVVNGKTVEKPDDPTKENSVFLGWYADEALTTPYAFTTTEIKANVTVYAKWAAKTVGVAEYTVSFNLGYEGGVAPEAITTISGKLPNGVVTPEREGYTFGGWWISMYEDANKLSFAYTDDTVFTANTTLFAVWHDNASGKLQAPAVTVTENLISWSTVEGANGGYQLTILAPDGSVLVNENVGATSRAYNFVNMPAGEYSVSVVAVASDSANNSEATVRSYANKMLDRVAQFQVVNGILVFNSVEHAQKYLITIDCGNDQHVHTAFDNGLSTTYYLANCPMQKGGILITVTAVAEGYASSVSETFAYDLTLGKVASVVYNAANDAFVWDVVPGAMSYLVTVTVDGNAKTFDNGTKTSFSVASFTGNITVSVVPASEGYNSPEATEGTCAKTGPATPDGLTLSGYVISWNAVAGATSYEVKIGNETVTVTTNSIDLSVVSMALEQGKFYEVQVKAINESNAASGYSTALKFGYFVMDPALVYNKNTVTWTPVLGVTEFEVSVQGGAKQIVTGTNSARVTLKHEGENVITVKYVYEGTASDVATITVYAHTIEYDTRSDDGSKFEYLAVGDEFSLPATGFDFPGYTFASWSNAPMGTAGNGMLYSAGAVFTGNAYTILYATWTPKDYKVFLQTDGARVEFTNITDGQEVTVTYRKDFTLPVPDVAASGMYHFLGWYTDPNGQGVQITDGSGASVYPYDYTEDINLYPYIDYNALSFTMQTEGAYAGTYMVTRGGSIAQVTDLVIPATYNNIPVTVIKENAFSGASKLRTIQIPDTIKLVGAKAFNNAYALESIQVYKGAEGNYEVFYFSENDSLIRKDVGDIMYLEFVPINKLGDYVVPTNVDKINSEAFRYARISSVVIPNNVQELVGYCFFNCSNLKSVTFEFGRTNPLAFAPDSFVGCGNIESIAFPSIISFTLEEIQSLLFGMKNLKTLVVEDGGENYATVGGMLTDAGKTTLLYCPKAYQGTVVIPTGITTILEKAFADCAAITSVTIPVRVTSIGSEAFSGCTAIKDVFFVGDRRADLTIGASAFAKLDALLTVTFDGSSDGELENGKITMGKSAFAASSAAAAKLQRVIIGAGTNLAAFSDSAFYNQIKLAEVVIGENVAVGKINANAFAGCASLTAFDVPGTVTSIAAYAFDGCVALKSLTFRAGEASLSIANNAFAGCSAIPSVTLPDRLSSFEASAFRGCSSLSAILVGANNPKYSNDANGILYVKETDDNGNPLYSELLFYPTAAIIANNGVINNLPNTIKTIGGIAFANNADLISITLPASLTKIGNSAFMNCANLADVIFLVDENATNQTLAIEQSAFENCVSLADDLVFPAYTKTIGVNAFRGAGFAKFVIPAGVTTIGAAAFAECANLVEITFNCTGNVTLADGTATIAETKGGVFAECAALTTVTLPANMTKISKYTFSGCTALQNVVIPTENSKLTTIGEGAFINCVALQTITIPASVKTIGANAFAATQYAPGSLTSITFAAGRTEKLTVGENAFVYQAQLSAITFPALVTLPADDLIPALFEGCSALAKIDFDGNNDAYDTLDGVLYNSTFTTLIFSPAANVGVYKDGQPTYEVIVPNTVTMVNVKAFYNCTMLKTITFAEFDKESENYGKPLLTIGDYNGYELNSSKAAIGGDFSSITTVNLPSHLKEIKGNAFANASAAPAPMTITFNPDSKIILANMALAKCPITTLVLPAGSQMGEQVFANCALLQSADLSGLAGTTLPASTFSGARSLTSVTLPEKITTLGSKVFAGCTSLKSFTIPSTVTSIQGGAFMESGLTSIVLPNSLALTSTTVGQSMFLDCKSLESVKFGTNVTQVPSFMFKGCTALKSVTFAAPGKLTTIGSYAFQHCSSLTTFDFTVLTALTNVGGVKNPGDEVFAGSGLVTVDLSKTQIKTLGMGFANVSTLTKFVFSEKTTKILNNAFTGCSSLSEIHLAKTFKLDMFIDELSNFVFADVPNAKFVFPAEPSNYTATDGVLYGKSNTLCLVLPGTEMDEFVIPSTVTAIGPYAFAFCDIKSIVVPTNVQTLNKHAFAYATATSITITDTIWNPSRLKTIDDHAFAYTAIQSIVIPDSVTTVNQYAFAHCPNLKSITTGAGMTSIPDCFAYGSTALEELIMQETITNIDAIFGDVYVDPIYGYQLKSVTIPASVEVMYSSFCYATNLETVIFAENSNLMEVYSNVFKDCASLKSITLPGGVGVMDDGVFEGCTSLEYVDLSATGLRDIFDYTFANTPSLKTVLLPEELFYIGVRAFYNTGLEHITIPASVEYLGNGAFEDAKALKTVTFEEGSLITAIDQMPLDVADDLGWPYPAINYDYGYYHIPKGNGNIFRGTTSLETVILPNGVTTICAGAFENSGISNLLMTYPNQPSQLTSIGDYAFANCANLAEFNYGSTLQTIGTAAFMNCTNLATIELGGALTDLGGMAFAFCSSLPRGYIPANVSKLAGNPYAGLDATKIVLDASNKNFILETYNGALHLTSSDKKAVYGVYGATGSYTMGTGATHYDYKMGALAGNAITELILQSKSGTTTVSDYLAMNCTALTSVTINQGWNTIGSYAFYNTGLTTVAFPASVMTLGSYVFANCDSLDNVVIPKTITQIGNYCFAYCDTLSDFTFEPYVNAPSSYYGMEIGTHFFYNCPNITEVILPTKIRISPADANMCHDGDPNRPYTLPSYMFAGTGIEIAVIPASITQFYTMGIFADCENLTEIRIVSEKPTGSSAHNYNDHMFEGCDLDEVTVIWGWVEEEA